MTNESITKTLNYTKVQIEKLSKQIKLGELEKVELKNVLENLRSVLDYLSGDVLDSIRKKTKNCRLPNKIYFPYGQRENHFNKSIDKNLPGLKDQIPQIFNLLKNIQPFVSKDNWIVDLCSLTNQAKHNELSKTSVKQKIVTNIGSSIKMSGSNNLIKNNYGNGRKLDDVITDDNGIPHVTRAYSFDTLFVIENRINFAGKEIEVIPFLQKCHSNIFKLTEEIKIFL